MKIVDLHCDTILEIHENRKSGIACNLRENHLHIDGVRLKKTDFLLQAFALFVTLEKGNDPWKNVLDLYTIYEEEIEANKDIFYPIKSKSDFLKLQTLDKVGTLLTVEEGGVCRGEIDNLMKLYEMGVRLITLTWNFPNELGYPNIINGTDYKGLFQPDIKHGLSHRGIEFVERMNEIGMLVDVSHLSDAGFYDVYKYAKMPFIASHSNARSICGCVRNLTDDMIVKLASKGGVVGLNYCADFLETKPEGVENPGTIEGIINHAKHIANVGGIDCVALGSDFDGILTHKELPGVDHVDKLRTAFIKAGFKEGDVDKICFQNASRVLLEVLK